MSVLILRSIYPLTPSYNVGTMNSFPKLVRIRKGWSLSPFYSDITLAETDHGTPSAQNCPNIPSNVYEIRKPADMGTLTRLSPLRSTPQVTDPHKLCAHNGT